MEKYKKIFKEAKLFDYRKDIEKFAKELSNYSNVDIEDIIAVVDSVVEQNNIKFPDLINKLKYLVQSKHFTLTSDYIKRRTKK